MGFLQDIALVAALISMVVTVLLIPVLPFIPGSVLVWVIGMLYWLVDRFQTAPIPGVLIFCGLMLVGATSNLWMQVLGVRAGGGGCLSTIASLVGGLVGAVLFFPLGGLIGAVAGAFLAEWAIHKDVRRAFTAGSTTFGAYILQVLVEMGIAIAMVVIFIFSR